MALRQCSGQALVLDRRNRRREAAFEGRRRYPRLYLDVDWFVESQGCSTLGRSLEISPRGARLPLTCKGAFSTEVTLYVALPGRARMFKAKGEASARPDTAWVIQFREASAEDLTLLARTLIEEYGVRAVPQLERRFHRLSTVEPRFLRDSP